MNVYESLLKKLNSGEKAVLCTVIATTGSVPRKKGAWMLVSESGITGTIGGGNMEFLAANEAKDLLKSGKSRIKTYELGIGGDANMICGGSSVVFFRFVDGKSRLFLEEAVSRKKEKILTLIKPDMSWQWHFEGENIEPSEDDIIMSEKPYNDIKTYVFGGGHISVQTVSLISKLGFSVTVFEDRPEFADPEKFPSAENVILGDFSRISDKIRIEENDFVLVMTRGHAFDYEVLTQVLTKNPAYIGVIGSRKKAEIMFGKLREAGFPDEAVSKIFSPVGLAINAETPEEIAVSIAAQMILERSKLK